MRDFAIVKEIDGQKIEVVSLISDACVTCISTDCARDGKTFFVINKRNFPLKENSIVRIGFPKILNAFLGLISLIFPIASAIAGCFLAPYFLRKFTFELTQINQAFITALFFLTSSFIVYIISRTNIHLTTPEVIQVM